MTDYRTAKRFQIIDSPAPAIMPKKLLGTPGRVCSECGKMLAALNKSSAKRPLCFACEESRSAMSDELLTVDQAAEALGIQPRSLIKQATYMMKIRPVDASASPRLMVFTRAEVERYRQHRDAMAQRSKRMLGWPAAEYGRGAE